MIKKTINYCWFGNDPKSKLIKKCIDSWKKVCPDYEIKEWNEKNFNVNMNDYIKEAYENKKWAFVSDYARLWIIYNYGGIYLDTDVELVKSLDELLKYEAFFASEDNKLVTTGLGFGAEKNNLLVKEMMDDYNNIHFALPDGKLDMLSCPTRNSNSIQDVLQNICFGKDIVEYNNIAFLPKEFLAPYNYYTKEMNKTEKTIGIHWYGMSWFDKKGKIKFELKYIIRKIIGQEKYNKIKEKK